MTTRTAQTHAPHAGKHSSRHAAVGADGPEVQVITDAVIPLEVDQSRRMRRYLIQMGIRVVCFVAAFVAYELYPNPFLVLGFIAAAAVLPYIAVVGVNAGRERGEGSGTYVTAPHRVLSGPPTRPEGGADEDLAGSTSPGAERYDIEISAVPPDGDARPGSGAPSRRAQDGPSA